MAALPSLRQLSYLVTLSETLHFTEAARRSFVTQSTLSGGIMELERLLGGVLVERDRQNVRLTPLGEEVVRRARFLLAEAQDLMRLSREMSEPFTGELHLGVIPTIAPFVLAPLLKAVQQQMPKLQLFLHEVQSEQAIERLEHGTLDIVLLALPFDTHNLMVQELRDEPLCLVYHELDTTTANANSMTELDLTRLLLLEEGHCLREHTLSACSISDLKQQNSLSASSLPTLIQMVQAQLGFTLLPAIALNSGILKGQNQLKVKSIDQAPMRTLALLTRKSTPLQAEFEQLAQIITPLVH
ncbi:LysR substrate-binding domain-containing protein [Alkanindiges sp. WGS2144]|uniref:hydrogen peroxide-inducible genes activator n=1 Tax=Alkanindiges sp. WGS2144 TaxID=3366808 RepID=UPI003750395F